MRGIGRRRGRLLGLVLVLLMRHDNISEIL